MPWTRFLQALRAGRFQEFEERRGLLQLVRAAFLKEMDLASMELGLRKTIAGVRTDFDKRWGYFGSMDGAGYFHGAVKDNRSAQIWQPSPRRWTVAAGAPSDDHGGNDYEFCNCQGVSGLNVQVLRRRG
jgi:hypothetical protein